MIGSIRKRIGVTLAALTALTSLAGCDTRVSATAATNAPVQYSHVYVTISQVWVNASATAGPDDAGWIKTTLDEPQTIDLAALTNDNLEEFASQLPVPTGTYNQLRLFLVDTDAALTSSAQSAGAQFNNEVDYFDASGIARTAPLAVPNAANGVSVPVKLDVLTSREAIFAALAAANTSTSNGGLFNNGTTSSFSNGTLGNGTTTNTSTSAVCDPLSAQYNPTLCQQQMISQPTTTSTTDTTATGSRGFGTTTATAAVVLDAGRDLARFVYSNVVGFTLNAQLSGVDLANVGTIRSQLDVSALTFDPNASRPDVQITAAAPDSAKTRNVPVLSAPLRADGTFVLYPFPLEKTSPTTYDLVVHGPGIQTMIIKSVPVQPGAPTSAAAVNLNNAAVNPAAASYAVNLSTASPVAARGARIGFYQTLSGSGELPYLIEERAVDPVSGVFALEQILPNDVIASGTFSAGATLTLTTSVPTEGTGAYRIAASAALFGQGDFSGTLTPPASTTTATTTFTAPTLNIPSGATSGTVTANITIASPQKYDKGIVLVTHDGAIVQTTALDSLLVPAQASGTLTIGPIPAGAADASFDAGTYSAEVWVWNSSDPTGSFSRQPATDLIDLRAADAATVALTVN
ncbi:MAG TPA: DUF4382 domain-containing protein [Steroidobacteraceae bacterium]|nr:DUF4382 domain-containing protein [Steroidobacteraceae bacterium]